MLYLQVMTWKNVELKLSDIRPKGRRSQARQVVSFPFIFLGVTLDSNFPNFYLNFCLINIFHLIIASRIEIFEIEILMCSNRFFFFFFFW